MTITPAQRATLDEAEQSESAALSLRAQAEAFEAEALALRASVYAELDAPPVVVPPIPPVVIPPIVVPPVDPPKPPATTALVLRNKVGAVIDGGTYSSIYVSGGSGNTIRNVEVIAPPATNINEQAVRVVKSPGFVIEGCTITGQATTVGVDQTDAGPAGLVKWLWAGEGIHVEGSPDADIRGNVISRFHQGVTFTGDRVTIADNRITDIRTSFIVGVPGDDCAITGNYLSGSHPWRWGTTPGGDHADCVHLWLNGATCDGLQIIGNTFDQGDGEAILGFNLQHINVGVGVGKFINTVIARNKVTLGQGQAFVLRGVSGKVYDNEIVALATGKATAQMRVYETQGLPLTISGTIGAVAVDTRLTAAQRALVTVLP